MFDRLKAFFKQASGPLTRMIHPTQRGFSLMRLLPRTDYDYKADVGDGTGSSSLMAPVQYIQRTFPEAPLALKRRNYDGIYIYDHPMIDLIDQPNPFYDGVQLWMSTVYAYCIWGNAYWLILRNALGDPVQLWFVPPWMIEPALPNNNDPSIFISHYEYQPGTEKIDVRVRDVVHFRHGIDPLNPQLGIAPLHSVMREAWSDDEASNWIASLLRNSGLPGMVISPDASGSNMNVLPMDVDEVDQYIRDMFTGDKRGKPLVLGGPTKVQEFGYDPEKMNLTHIRNTAEERACACLGIPAAVVGLGTGLESTKVGATMREYAKIAWTDGIIPLQRILAAELKRSLLPNFERRPQQFHVCFDYSKITALQDNLTDVYERANIGVMGGWLSVARAKELVGEKPEPNDKVYLRDSGTVAVPLDGSPPISLLPAPADEEIDDEDITEAEVIDDEKVLLEKQGFHIQTLIFPKDKWENAAACRKWALIHGYRAHRLFSTSGSWRLRQREPKDFIRLRTICINPGRHATTEQCLVKAVGGGLKSTGIDVTTHLSGPFEESLM